MAGLWHKVRHNVFADGMNQTVYSGTLGSEYN